MTIDPSDARQSLEQIQSTSAAVSAAFGQDRRRHAAFAAGIGLAMGAYVFTCMYVMSRSMPLWILSLVLFVGFTLWAWRKLDVSRRSVVTGWRRTYRPAYNTSLVLFVAAIVVNTVWYRQTLWPAVLCGVAVAVPLLAGAWLTLRQDSSTRSDT